MLINPQLPGDSFLWPGTGPNTGTGVLLSHGFCATTAEVRPLAERLHAAGYTVAGPLLPGHKTTPTDLATKHWQNWAAAFAETHALLKKTCDRVIVGGESMGGLLSLYYASEHPEIAAILTYAPAIRMSYFTKWGVTLLAPFVKEFKPAAGPHTQVDDYWQGYNVRPSLAVRQLYTLMAQVTERFPLVKQPLLIVQGRLDKTIAPYGAQILYDQVGSVVKELHWMDQSTHCVILDKELPAVTDLTLNFIAKVLASETV